LNSLRLREMLKLIKQVREATGGDPNMDWLKPFTSTRHVQPGEKVFHKGEPGGDMFVVMSGHFRLVETGIELKARDVVGEFGLLTRKHGRTQTLECTEAGILLRITYGQVEQLFFQNARFGFYFLQLIAHRLLQNNERLEMELAHYRRAPVAYRPRWQRALSRTEKSAADTWCAGTADMGPVPYWTRVHLDGEAGKLDTRWNFRMEGGDVSPPCAPSLCANQATRRH